MAPIPPSSSLPGISRHLNDIRTYQLPRLSSPSGAPLPTQLFDELVEELRVDLEGVRRGLEREREMIAFGAGGPEAKAGVDEAEREYYELKSLFRSTVVQAKKNMAVRHARIQELSRKGSEKDESASKTTPVEEKGAARSAADMGIGGDDELQTKTNEVTSALRRTTALMQTELERSVLSVQMLESSTQTLTLTQTLHETYTSLLTSSHHLIQTLSRADTLDRYIILASLLFFLLVCGWIVKRRVLDKALGAGWWVVGGVGKGVGWYVGGSWKLVKMGFGGGGPATRPEGLEVMGFVDEGALPRVGQDSAVGSLDSEFEYIRPHAANGVDDYVAVAEPAPAGIATGEKVMNEIMRDMEKGGRGKVEILDNNEGRPGQPRLAKDEL
ncbi:hypothetical protein L202_04357 [Cryptococcus amylolentus CBS 6039]|uniref:Sec20 C-terminal domain-containing protein n=2 Tax=Cryptococcus amylolentus TaxID=104669 RepID=A0A1E3HSZ8_9TREE|nr:hypothetical protein L202_04357 [Cryptococcus amylolentus CBS 6039]ODN78806.1 hypothetical protein L202_04357 [Cryptococcus amylolentus CBS 6039]ODO06705.1 hypothetical protein I350_04063 [Cryptococcus amylolentus CBS 6273]